MRAAVIPAVNGAWEIHDIPTPEPGCNQVLIKVHSSGVCYTDVHMIHGKIPVTFPRILGHEPAGEVVAVGPGVRKCKVGDRVGVPWVQATCGRCEWCMRNRPMFCQNSIETGIHVPGAHADFFIAHEDGPMLLPEGLDYSQAAPMFCAGYTVWSGIQIAEPRPLERIAVVGVGGLGHLAIQFAKAAGFDTFAVSNEYENRKFDNSAEKKARFIKQELGADEVFESGKDLDAGGGADILIATSNSYEVVLEAMNGLRHDGRLILIGVSKESVPLTSKLIRKRHRIIASIQNNREHLYEALQLAAKGKVKVIEEQYPLEEIGKAYARLEEGTIRYRGVIQL